MQNNFRTGRQGNLASLLNRIELIEEDARSCHVVREAVDGLDTIPYLAVSPSVPGSIRDPIATNEVRLGGTLHTLDAAKDA